MSYRKLFALLITEALGQPNLNEDYCDIDFTMIPYDYNWNAGYVSNQYGRTVVGLGFNMDGVNAEAITEDYGYNWGDLYYGVVAMDWTTSYHLMDFALAQSRIAKKKFYGKSVGCWCADQTLNVIMYQNLDVVAESQFDDFNTAIKEQQWDDAAAALLQTNWCTQFSTICIYQWVQLKKCPYGYPGAKTIANIAKPKGPEDTISRPSLEDVQGHIIQ